MLRALIGGERDAQKLASMARGRLRRKLPELEVALTGQFTEHHGRLIALSLELIEMLARQIQDLNEQIGLLVKPLTPQIEQLTSIPGIDAIAARDIIGEIGTDMSRFGSAARLSSWAKMSPGLTTKARASVGAVARVKGIVTCVALWCNVHGTRVKPRPFWVERFDYIRL